jgi:hypothetical protein
VRIPSPAVTQFISLSSDASEAYGSMDIIQAWDESDLNWPQRKLLIEYLIETYESINADGDGVTNSLKLHEDFGSSLVLLMGRLFKCLMKTILNDENCSLIVHLLSICVTSTSGAQVSEEFVTVDDLNALMSVLGKFDYIRQN